MLYYTIIPDEDLFSEEDGSQAEASLLEVKHNGVTMLVTPTGNGRGRIQRLISSNPADYLHPALQPGNEIPICEHGGITGE